MASVGITRSGGFPFDWLDELRLHQSVAAADAIVDLDRRVNELASKLLGELARVRRADEWVRPAGRRAERALSKGRPVDASSVSTSERLVRLAREHAQLLRTRDEIVATGSRSWLREIEVLRAVLRARAADPRLVEAVRLNSREAADAMGRYLARAAPRARWSEAELTTIAYLQRFCSKNETAAFVGPTGDCIVDDAASSRVTINGAPGEFPRRRPLHLSYWAAEALIRAMSPDLDLLDRPLAPSTSPLGEELRREGFVRGQESARDRATRNRLTVADAKTWLEDQLARGSVTDVYVPDPYEVDPWPQIVRYAERTRRRSWVDRVSNLREAIDRCADSSGDSRLAHLERVEEIFSDLTELPAQRGHGRHYTDRLVVNEDCPAPFSLSLSHQFATEIMKAILPDISKYADQASVAAADYTGGAVLCGVDVMIAAESLSALNQGEFEVILSEVHHIVPLTALPFARFVRDSDRCAAELVRECLSPFRPAIIEQPRCHKVVDIVPNADTVVIQDGWLRDRCRGRAVARCDLDVLADRDTLELREVGSEAALVLIPHYEDPGSHPLPSDLARFALPAIDSGDAQPKQRRSWRFKGSDLPVGERFDTFESFVELRRWRASHRVSERVFVKADSQEKPWLLDFMNPLSARMSFKRMRQATQVTMTDMAPAPDQLWLRGSEGRHTLELRLFVGRCQAARQEPEGRKRRPAGGSVSADDALV